MIKPSAVQIALAKRLRLPETASRDEICRAAFAKMAKSDADWIMAIDNAMDQAPQRWFNLLNEIGDQMSRAGVPKGSAPWKALDRAWEKQDKWTWRGQ